MSTTINIYESGDLNAIQTTETIAVSDSGTTTLTAPENCKNKGFVIQAEVGSGAYSHTLDLSAANRQNGDILDILIEFDGMNPEIVVQWDGDILVTIPSNASTGNAQFRYDGTNFKLWRAAL